LSDEYYKNLIKEYSILSAKYSLQPLHGWLWKFSRLRPSNFPTVRLSQLAAMLSVSGGLFSRVIEAHDIKGIKEIFEVSASEYWDNHFVFGKKSAWATKNTGSQAIEIFLINAVIPVIFVYGWKRDYQNIVERALSFMEEIPAEENVIISEWQTAGVLAESAFYSQALIQLRNEYCKRRRCLNCRVGNIVISKGKKLKDNEELILEPSNPLNPPGEDFKPS
jgi:hypothetical protein